MKITVTQEDIDNSMPKNGWLCPLALAARRVVSTGYIPFVVDSRFVIYKAGEIPGYFTHVFITGLPEEAIKVIRLYDTYLEKPEPFEFEIADLPEYIRQTENVE